MLKFHAYKFAYHQKKKKKTTQKHVKLVSLNDANTYMYDCILQFDVYIYHLRISSK